MKMSQVVSLCHRDYKRKEGPQLPRTQVHLFTGTGVRRPLTQQPTYLGAEGEFVDSYYHGDGLGTDGSVRDARIDSTSSGPSLFVFYHRTTTRLQFLETPDSPTRVSDP